VYFNLPFKSEPYTNQRLRALLPSFIGFDFSAEQKEVIRSVCCGVSWLLLASGRSLAVVAAVLHSG